MFKTDPLCNRPGFQMKFSNGWTISVQWHHGSYCDGRNSENGESPNAEIAIWDSKGEWYDFGNDTVKGYCSTDEVAGWINIVSKWA